MVQLPVRRSRIKKKYYYISFEKAGTLPKLGLLNFNIFKSRVSKHITKLHRYHIGKYKNHIQLANYK